jgi:phytoene synthase
MQLTNIARDVGEDARSGRIYLPLSWMREVGIDPDAWLAAADFCPKIGVLVQRLLREADKLYSASEAGIAQLPFACRPGIRAARLLYAEIGAAIGRLSHDSVTQRAFVRKRRKAELLLRAFVAPSRARTDCLPALAEARFLIDAIEPASLRTPLPRAKMAEQVVWVVELFDRIERRRQVQGL